MSNEIQGIDIKVLVREVGEDDWDELVCEIDSQSQITNETTETATKCGTKIGIKEAKGNFSGNAVFNVTPVSGEASYEDIANWQNGVTLLEFLMVNESFTAEDGSPIAEGAVLHQFCTGWFVDTTFTGATGEVGKFSWTFKPKTAIVLSGSSS